MKTISIVNGHTKVPVIIQGCMRMPTLSIEDAARVIRCAVDHSINFFDHATCYGNVEAERRFGDALPSAGLRREDIIIQYKVGLHF